MKVLLVEDELAQRMLLGDILREKGWEVFEAEEGREGLEKLAAEKIDVIISDVYMTGMDGLQFHGQVRADARFKMIPFIFVSAFDDRHTRDAVENPAIDAFLRKGFPAETLTAWVEYLATPVERRGSLRHPGTRATS